MTQVSREFNTFMKVAFMNIRGQTGFNLAKQLYIESFLARNRIDILHLQEVEISSDSFEKCDFINSSYTILPNNSPTKYGTASLIRSEFTPENVMFDCNGRVIVFNSSKLVPSLWN